MSRIMGGASRIIQGIQDFQDRVFGNQKSMFRRLGEGQAPSALFITCSDSRINPNLLTQTDPGELFILRNAGNLVPARGACSGSAATLEYALKVLHIHDVIVCGHSKCGAIQGLLNPDSLGDLPAVRDWLTHASAILPAVEQIGATLSSAEKYTLAIERNVLLQLEHIKTYPFVCEALAAGKLRLHGWMYFIESGQVTAYTAGKERFVPLLEAVRQKWLAPVPVSAADHGKPGESI